MCGVYGWAEVRPNARRATHGGRVDVCSPRGTLQAWRLNVENAWPQLDPQRYDERFKHIWRFYLAASMASFCCRHAQLWQLVLSPHGVPGGYVAPR